MTTFALLIGNRNHESGLPVLALPLRGRTLLEHVLDCLRSATVRDILVVLAARESELAPLAEAAGAQVEIVPDAIARLGGLVEYGLRRLDERFHPGSDDQCLLTQAIHPPVEVLVVYDLIQAKKGRPDCSIFLPTYGGKRGHPRLVDWKDVQASGGSALGMALDDEHREATPEIREVSVDSEGILLNLDAPDGYPQLRKQQDRAPEWLTLGSTFLTAGLPTLFALYLGASGGELLFLGVGGILVGVISTSKVWALIDPTADPLTNILSVTAASAGFGGFVGALAGAKAGGWVIVGALGAGVLFGLGGLFFVCLVVAAQQFGLRAYRKAVAGRA
jgi:CTP:molybdopterin cytidylyltransferase MocA